MIDCRTVVRIAALAAAIACSSSHHAFAQVCPPQEQDILLAPDGYFAESFGNAIAMSGATAIIGAHLHPARGDQTGAAYVFDTTTGDLVVKLSPDDPQPYQRFADSVAIDNNVAVVGCPWDADQGTHAGAAYIFDATTGVQIAKLLRADGAAFDNFGQAVAVSGQTVIVTTTVANALGLEPGAAYLFDAANGAAIRTIMPDDSRPDQDFGNAVAVDGDTAIIGARWDDDNGFQSGAAYLFDITTGNQLHKLLPDDGAPNELFGQSVAINGNVAVIGASLDDDLGGSAGSAYLFDVSTGMQLAKLFASDGEARDNFGNAVAINGSTALIGASGNDDFGSLTGSAYLFDVATARQTAKFLPAFIAPFYSFGSALAMNDTTAVVGAPGYIDGFGAAHVFDITCDPISLRIAGGCPGRIGFVVEDATPNGDVAFFYARGEGTVIVPPGNLCAGATLHLDATTILGETIQADATGAALSERVASSLVCGRVYVQAIDFTTCRTSNVVFVK